LAAKNTSGRKALIIGISDYNKLESLAFCKNDGQEMFNVLSALNYEIQEDNVLLGYVKWDRLRDSIYDFFSDEHTKPDDMLLFYYSGHGVPDVEEDVFLATSEIDPDVPSRRGFNFSELTKMIRESVSRSIVAILDCCYSGSARISKGHEDNAAKLGRSTIDRQSERLAIRGEGKCILAASQAREEAYVLEEQNHSVFTYYLLQGLKGKAKEIIDNHGNVTVDSLDKYIYTAMMSLNPRPKQKPIRKVEASGDIILAYYPELAKRQSIDTQLDSSYKPPSLNDNFIPNEMKASEKNKKDNIMNFSSNIETDDERVKKYVQEHEGSFSYFTCAMDLHLSVSKVRRIISRLGLL
jgi:uncharacterized caspase-like protein